MACDVYDLAPMVRPEVGQPVNINFCTPTKWNLETWIKSAKQGRLPEATRIEPRIGIIEATVGRGEEGFQTDF